MRSPRIPSALMLSVLLASSGALASSTRVPGPIVQRDLTVPDRALRIDGGPRWPFPEGQAVFQVQEGGGDPAWLNGGVTFGISPKFHLGAVVPLQIAPGDPDLHDPRVHFLYEFIGGGADIGFFFQANVPFEGDIGTVLGFPMQFELGDKIRLDTGPFLRTWFYDNDDDTDVGADLTVPFELPINVTRNLFLGPEAGIVTYNEFDDVAYPVGFFIGYTMAGGGGTIGDLSFRVRDLNADDFGNTVHLIFAADLFFDL